MASVWGMYAISQPESVSPATVRLTPSTANEPLCATKRARLAGSAIVTRAPSPSGGRARAPRAAAVHVTLHQVSAQPVGEPERALEVDRGAGSPVGERREPQRLGHRLDREPPGLHRDRGQAAARARDAVADARVLEHAARPDPEASPRGPLLHRLHATQLFHESGEHHSSPRSTTIRASSPTSDAETPRPREACSSGSASPSHHDSPPPRTNGAL